MLPAAIVVAIVVAAAVAVRQRRGTRRLGHCVRRGRRRAGRDAGRRDGRYLVAVQDRHSLRRRCCRTRLRTGWCPRVVRGRLGCRNQRLGGRDARHDDDGATDRDHRGHARRFSLGNDRRWSRFAHRFGRYYQHRGSGGPVVRISLGSVNGRLVATTADRSARRSPASGRGLGLGGRRRYLNELRHHPRYRLVTRQDARSAEQGGQQREQAQIA